MIYRSLVLVALLVHVLGGRVRAQPQPTPPTGQLVISGQAAVNHASTRSAGVEWLRTSTRSPLSLDVGAFTGATNDGWFSYGRMGGLLRQGPSLLGATLDLGGGREGTRSFGYVRLRSSTMVPLRGQDLQIEGDVDHVRIAESVVTAVRTGLAVQISPQVSVRVSAHVHAAGGDIDPGVSMRADYSRARVRLLGGLFVSRRSPQPAPLTDVTPALYATRSLFGGVEVDTGGPRVTVVIDVSRQYQGHVTTLLAGVALPRR